MLTQFPAVLICIACFVLETTASGDTLCTRILAQSVHETRRVTPIEDPAFNQFMMTQKRNTAISRALCLPVELNHIIGCYANYNDIRALFDILPSPCERRHVIGFPSYDQMDRHYPSRKSKVDYLQSDFIAEREIGIGPPGGQVWGSSLPLQQPGTVYMFDAAGWFIKGINWSLYRRYRKPNGINWGEVKKFKNLNVLKLGCIPDITISMEDLALLPSSIKYLDVRGNRWTSKWPTEGRGYVELLLLPSGLRYFQATGCLGMRVLDLIAPQSKLTHIDVQLTGICEIFGWEDAPPQLEKLMIDEEKVQLSPEELEDLPFELVDLYDE